MDLTESFYFGSLGHLDQPHTLKTTQFSSFLHSSSIPQKLRAIIGDLRQVPLNSWVTRIHRVQTQSKQTNCKDLRIILSCSFEPTIFHRINLSFERCLVKTSSFQFLLSHQFLSNSHPSYLHGCMPKLILQSLAIEIRHLSAEFQTASFVTTASTTAHFDFLEPPQFQRARSCSPLLP